LDIIKLTTCMLGTLRKIKWFSVNLNVSVLIKWNKTEISAALNQLSNLV
jgi:hypothetical protein